MMNKIYYDRLVAAGWIEQVKDVESKEQREECMNNRLHSLKINCHKLTVI